jgi:hypothetical protein
VAVTTEAVEQAPASAVPSNVAAAQEKAEVGKIVAAATAEQAAKPSSNGKVYADWDELLAKSVRSLDYKLLLKQPDGEEKERWIHLEALGGPDYDALVDKHPPTQKQREQGEVFNRDTFMPALIAACATKPKLSVEQLKQLRESKAWSPGEFGGMFLACQRICNATTDVSFTVTG